MRVNAVSVNVEAQGRERPWFEELAAVFAAVRGAAGKACSAAWRFAWYGSPARMAWAERQAAGFGSEADRTLALLLLSAALAALSLAAAATAAVFGGLWLLAWAAERLAGRLAAGKDAGGAVRGSPKAGEAA
ncbi:hypothetical protein SEF58_03430 [Neomoorella humiferrea]|uniref:Uncharacterized protein n=1 Tax=Neomoorella humiferrea TaxID=676965 RepID=A0A2T0AV72_9FIRM|nr:hypothetical protein [Moorella humiferrea]PRR74504.1 hypothetical protein MOHU_08170 [Moorella humiferrea]